MNWAKSGILASLVAVFSSVTLAGQPTWVTVVSPRQLPGHTWQIDKAHIEHLKDGRVSYWAKHIAETPDQNGVKVGVGKVNAVCGGASVTIVGETFYAANGNVISDPHLTQVAGSPPGSAWDLMTDRACAM